MTTAIIVRNPRIATGVFPDWINEACIGLKMCVSHGQEGDCDAMCIFSHFEASILPDDLITLLRTQHPQERSSEAADWINQNIMWGGAMSFRTTCFDQEIPLSGRYFLEEESTTTEYVSIILKALQGKDISSYEVSFRFSEDCTHAFVVLNNHITKDVLESVFYNSDKFNPSTFVSEWYATLQSLH